MLSNHLAETERQLDQIKQIVTASYGQINENSALSGTIDTAYRRAYDHCASLIRAYATFEICIINFTNQWINWCMKNSAKTIFESDSARDLYEKGLSEIAKRKTETRFSDIDRGAVARSLAAFYQKSVNNASIDPSAFFATQPNLRLNHIKKLWIDLSIGDPETWINSCTKLADFCQTEGFQPESAIKEIVDKRNEAAHGNEMPSEIFGKNEIISRINLLIEICRCLHQFLIFSVCKTHFGDDYFTLTIGKVTKCWPRRGAFELKTTKKSILTGAKILFISEATGEIFDDQIKSIMIEGRPVIGSTGIESALLGISTDRMPREGMIALNISAVPGLDFLLSRQ